MESVRHARANAEIIKALSVIIKDKLNDPRLKSSFITLTYANVSADFRHCKVGFTVLNGNVDLVQRVLRKSEGYIKRELLNIVKLPYAPELEFIYDIGGDNSERVNKILSELVIPDVDNEESDEDL